MPKREKELAGVSALGAYQKPCTNHEASLTPGGQTDIDPIDRLAQDLNQLCIEAVDAFELAAHVEALGYNRYRIQREFGLQGPFELGRRLFMRIPRRHTFTTPAPPPETPWTNRLIPALALLVAMASQLYLGPAVWMGAIWIIVWSQAGSALFWRGRGDLEPIALRRLITLELCVGVLGVALAGGLSSWPYTTWTAGALWMGLAVLLWLERPGKALALCGGALILILTRLPLTWICAGTLALLPGLLYSVPARPSLLTLRWTRGQLLALLPYAAYGLGQGLPLHTLVCGAGWTAVPGFLLFVVVLFSAESLVIRMKAGIRADLWRETRHRYFMRKLRLRLIAYAAILAAPALIALLLGLTWAPSFSYVVYVRNLALLALGLSLGLAHLCLFRPRWPALAFLIAGIGVTAGLPYEATVLAASALLLGVLLRQTGRVLAYGVNLV
jgi:hypothetical protein